MSLAFVFAIPAWLSLQAAAQFALFGSESVLFSVRLMAAAIAWLGAAAATVVTLPSLAPGRIRLLRTARGIAAAMTLGALAVLVWIVATGRMPLFPLLIGGVMALAMWVGTFAAEREQARRARTAEEPA